MGLKEDDYLQGYLSAEDLCGCCSISVCVVTWYLGVCCLEVISLKLSIDEFLHLGELGQGHGDVLLFVNSTNCYSPCSVVILHTTQSQHSQPETHHSEPHLINNQVIKLWTSSLKCKVELIFAYFLSLSPHHHIVQLLCCVLFPVSSMILL